MLLYKKKLKLKFLYISKFDYNINILKITQKLNKKIE